MLKPVEELSVGVVVLDTVALPLLFEPEADEVTSASVEMDRTSGSLASSAISRASSCALAAEMYLWTTGPRPRRGSRLPMRSPASGLTRMMKGCVDPDNASCMNLSTLPFLYEAEADVAGIIIHSATAAPQTALRPSDPIPPPEWSGPGRSKDRSVELAADCL